MAEIIRVSIDAGACLHHGCCEAACPEVFALPGPGDPRNEAFVKPGAEALFKTLDVGIRKAVEACPVAAVLIEER